MVPSPGGAAVYHICASKTELFCVFRPAPNVKNAVLRAGCRQKEH
jgi:hypothetical protein